MKIILGLVHWVMDFLECFQSVFELGVACLKHNLICFDTPIYQYQAPRSLEVGVEGFKHFHIVSCP
mgnify:FL=1